MGKQSAPEQPQLPKFIPIDFNKSNQQAVAGDIASYGLSDEDFKTRFPGLFTGEQEQFKSAYDQLTGPLDPTVQSSFVNDALAKSFSSFGGGQSGASVGPGSIGNKTAAVDIAGNVSAKEDYDRSNFQDQLAQQKPRGFGLTGADAANIYNYNLTNANSDAGYRYAGAVQQGNADRAASAANTQSTIGTALAIAGIIASFASDKRLKKNIKQVGTSGSGIPIKEFSYKGSKDKYIGAVAQDVEKVIPEAVVQDGKGIKGVIYSMLDVPFGKVKNA